MGLVFLKGDLDPDQDSRIPLGIFQQYLASQCQKLFFLYWGLHTSLDLH